jgi:hypothetical protein
MLEGGRGAVCREARETMTFDGSAKDLESVRLVLDEKDPLHRRDPLCASIGAPPGTPPGTSPRT